MNDLVEFLVKPFLEGLDEDTNLEYDGSVPAEKDGDDFKKKMLKNKQDLKKLKEFLIKNKKSLNENLVTSLVDGGTNEFSAFASIEGYYKYSLKRSENSGYKFLKDTFNPEFVYGNENPAGPKEISNKELQKILEAYHQIDRLYLEYALNVDYKENSSLADDNSDYDSTIAELPKTSKLKKQTVLPKQSALGNDYNGRSDNTQLDYKHIYDNTPRGKHI